MQHIPDVNKLWPKPCGLPRAENIIKGAVSFEAKWSHKSWVDRCLLHLNLTIHIHCKRPWPHSSLYYATCSQTKPWCHQRCNTTEPVSSHKQRRSKEYEINKTLVWNCSRLCQYCHGGCETNSQCEIRDRPMCVGPTGVFYDKCKSKTCWWK